MRDTNYYASAYRGEINRALTEFLFGEDEALDPIPFDAVAQAAAKRRAAELTLTGTQDQVDLSDSTLFSSESDRGLLGNKVRYYVRRRHQGEQPDQGDLDHYYEQRLYNKHWPGQNSRYVQLLIIEGVEGVGKSTFLRYYFQYYLPNLYELCGENEVSFGSRDQWRAECQRHLVLHVNLKRVSSVDQLYETVYTSFRNQISKKFPDLDTEECYAMWDKDARGWDSTYHKNRQESENLTTEQYRGNYVAKRGLNYNDEKWVSAAISYLASKQTKGHKRQWFITWLFDNADQTREEVQEELLNFVLDRIAGEERRIEPSAPVKDPRLALWKVIIPLRPETLRVLWPRLQPLPNMYEPLLLGKLIEEELLITRGELLEKEIKDCDRHVVHNVPHDPKQQPVMELTPPAAAARQIRSWFTAKFAGDSTELIEDTTARGARELYEDLANGSTRRLLLLRRRLTMSPAVLQQIDLARKGNWSLPLSAFYFIEGMICGEKGNYDPDEAGNVVLNLFDLGVDSQTPHSVLVGCHAVYLLNRDKVGEWSRVTSDLSSVGYGPDLESCRNHFVERELLKDIGEAEGGGRQYYIERRIVRAHWQLLRERAYLDNMAIRMGGRIRDDFARHIRSTSSIRHEDFIDRVRSTIMFIAYLKECEDAVRNIKTARDRHKKSDEAFAQTFNDLGLPCVYDMAASLYAKMVDSRIEKSRALRETLQKQRTRWARILASKEWAAIHDVKYDENDRLKAIIREPH